jgi:hypothetical protein
MKKYSVRKEIQFSKVDIQGEAYFKINNADDMRPFFMSIVSASNHWMFISSNTGLSAGRKNAQHALFPYYTDDKITELSDITGTKSIYIIDPEGDAKIWEPFSYRYEGVHDVSRNLYKSVYGNKIIFEEINHDLSLTFSFKWSTSDKYGFVKTSQLVNTGANDITISYVDGIQNIIPHGVPSDLQNGSSNLVDAYKRSELNLDTGLGIYALSAIIVDRAEPSEALKANVVWSLGIKDPLRLMSSLQLNSFRRGHSLSQETDVKAEKGAYFLHETIELAAAQHKEWMIIANVNQTHNDVAELNHALSKPTELEKHLLEDIALGTTQLIQLNGTSDSKQLTADTFKDARHFSNTLFNIMRGGIFDFNYQIEKSDFKKYIHQANKEASKRNKEGIENLSELITLSELRDLAKSSDDKAFQRLCFEYLPLKFSRRHGDPSRPWNVFSINTRDELTGEKILDYQGNWRDIFQNWEALAFSYPDFIESMIHKFLNATTFEGYNPYRVTKDGFDWETIEPDDPWSYIGYWGDHQIIYLLKFLEFIENVSPGQLETLFSKDVFVYANVPYKIKGYEDILQNPKDTILFDVEADAQIRAKRERDGADGALVTDTVGNIYTVNFIEKILATVLAKVSNFIPEGGIWLNTQRPEWNDANNALVGDGLSMVTLYYLNRFLKFFKGILDNSENSEFGISSELVNSFNAVNKTLNDNKDLLSSSISDVQRKDIVDQLGKASADYRQYIYNKGFSNTKSNVSKENLISFIDTTLKYFEHTIKANRRDDNLYHAYNLMTSSDNEISVSYLYEMLEGQVSVLSANFLTSKEALDVLDALRASKLYREDQFSYILYPNKQLPLFREKNTIQSEDVDKSELIKKLISSGDQTVVTEDVFGKVHFNGNFRNSMDLVAALNKLDKDTYGELLSSDKKIMLEIFECVFQHKTFTGRSGTFFGYEGLGSIYWHMVSKLQLAVLECCQKAINEKEDQAIIDRLIDHYYDINAGLGLHKSPELYGAFPTDPYSHTPGNKGAQQPGMTGQVKEDVISRFGELGVTYKDGCLSFYPFILKKEEFLTEKSQFEYYDVSLNKKSLHLPVDSLCFTICQIPVIYKASVDEECIEVTLNDQTTIKQNGHQLTSDISKDIFSRNGNVDYITVNINPELLK